MAHRNIESPRDESSDAPAGPFKVYFQYAGALDLRELHGVLISDSPRAPTEIETTPDGSGWIYYAFDDQTLVSDRDATVSWLTRMTGMTGIRWEAA